MEKLVKARKQHICSCCSNPILPGEMYYFGKSREPMYATDVMGNDVQEGIEYINWRLCEDREACNIRHEQIQINIDETNFPRSGEIGV